MIRVPLQEVNRELIRDKFSYQSNRYATQTCPAAYSRLQRDLLGNRGTFRVFLPGGSVYLWRHVSTAVDGKAGSDLALIAKFFCN